MAAESPTFSVPTGGSFISTIEGPAIVVPQVWDSTVTGVDAKTGTVYVEEDGVPSECGPDQQQITVGAGDSASVQRVEAGPSSAWTIWRWLPGE